MSDRVEVINITCYGGTPSTAGEKHDPERIITFIRDGDGWGARVREAKTMLEVDDDTDVPDDPDQRWRASQVRPDRSNVYYLYPMKCPVCGIDAPASDPETLNAVLDNLLDEPRFAMRSARFPAIVDIQLPALSTRLGGDAP